MKTIIADDSADSCYICGKRAQHVHHMLHGSRRERADKYGLTCHLCADCHIRLHDKGIFDRELQVIAQEAFEALYGRDMFLRIFGKNYKED